MLSTEGRVELMTKHLPNSPIHCLVASAVLTKLEKELIKLGMDFQEDETWPYHIIVLWKGREVSLYCGGFSKAIDIQLLKKDGSADWRFKEVRRLTPEGAVNYVRRRLGG